MTLQIGLLALVGLQPLAPWQPQPFHADANLRGLSVVDAHVVWVSGTKGTFGRTIDGGKSWTVGVVPGAEKLDFRDVEAFNDKTAYLLAAGPGEDSRVYKTTDAGQTWTLQFKNPDTEAFFDAIAFWDEQNGIALSDPIRGRFHLIHTTDGGANWKRLRANSLPPALPSEGAFAASGTCLVTHGEHDAWFATGGAKTSRVFHSANRGLDWTVSDTPIPAGRDGAGAFSIGVNDRNSLMIVGGDYKNPNDFGHNAALSTDAGKTWTAIEKPFGYRSGVSWAKDRWVAVGTNGSDVSNESGTAWKSLDKENYNSVRFTKDGDGWAVGAKGRVVRFVK